METRVTESGKEMKMLTVRTPEELHRALKMKAAEEGQTVASIIEELIRRYLQEMTTQETIQEKVLPVPRKKGERPLPSDANYFVSLAINHLECIRNDDPRRGEELDKVVGWITKYRKEFNGYGTDKRIKRIR